MQGFFQQKMKNYYLLLVCGSAGRLGIFFAVFAAVFIAFLALFFVTAGAATHGTFIVFAIALAGTAFATASSTFTTVACHCWLRSKSSHSSYS
jgi:hypothetical protein